MVGATVACAVPAAERWALGGHYPLGVEKAWPVWGAFRSGVERRKRLFASPSGSAFGVFLGLVGIVLGVLGIVAKSRRCAFSFLPSPCAWFLH